MGQRSEGPLSFLCLPWPGRVLRQSGPCGGTGSSLARRVFRLGGLWLPKSLRSKATHTPAILEATRATLPAPDLAKAGEWLGNWGSSQRLGLAQVVERPQFP